MQNLSFFNKSSIISAKNLVSIKETMKEKIKNGEIVPNKTLVLVDLDLTLFDRKGIMSDLYPADRKNFLDSLGDQELVEIVYAQSPYTLIEVEIPGYIKELQEQGFLVLGFTSRRTGKATKDAKTTVQEDACTSLNQLGVRFSAEIPDKKFEIAPDLVQLENPHLRAYEIIEPPQLFGKAFGTSTIFTANYQKWQIIDKALEYLNSLNYNISQVVAWDDKKEYLSKLKDSCESSNKVVFTGIHYTYALDNKPPLDPTLIKIQKECLLVEKKFITDEEALERKTKQSAVSLSL